MTYTHKSMTPTEYSSHHTLASTNTNMTNPPSTLAHLTHIYYNYALNNLLFLILTIPWDQWLYIHSEGCSVI